MGIKQRVIEYFGGATADQMREVTNRMYEAGLYDGMNGNDDPPSGTLKSFNYRRSPSKGLRDFTKMTTDEIHSTVWSLWQSSPVAKRLMTLKRDHIIGTNPMPKCDDEDLLEIVNAFWDKNEMKKHAPEFALQLFLFGEQILPASVRVADGRIQIGYIDPRDLCEDRVSKGVIKHPENALEDWAVSVGEPNNKRIYRIIREDAEYVDGLAVVGANHEGVLVTWEQAAIQPWELKMLKDHGRTQYDGSVFYFGVNRVSNQTRGMSDLVQLADWIDQADATLWAMAEREQFAGFFAFDVTMKGAGKPEINERRKELSANPPKRGSVNLHNDAEDWNMWSPDLKQYASIASFIAQMTNILGGIGFPLAWYGYGNDTNRATLGEQATPSEKSLEYDQGIVEDMFNFILRFVRDQAIIAGAYTGDEDEEVTIELPKIRAEDLMAVVTSFSPLVAALSAATAEGWNTKETAAKAWHKALNSMGLEIDTTAELEAAEAEAEAEEEKQADADNQQLQGLFDGEDDNGNTEDDSFAESALSLSWARVNGHE